MKNFFYILVIVLISVSAHADWEKEFSGNIEGQIRNTQNNKTAQEELRQLWNRDDFMLFYGNISGKMTQSNYRVEANWFGRQSKSSLYEGRFLAPQSFTFPNRLVVRDIFRLQHVRTEDDYKTESILNKFIVGVDLENHRFSAGRLYINYGLGEVFNPINPFNQPTGLTSISQVAQGSDGANYTYFFNQEHSLEIYLLGDKAINNYNGEIDSTFWAHGEWQATENFNWHYVFGNDQNRLKAGTQLSYQFDDALTFLQAFYQSDYTNDDLSHPLWDVVLGYDEQLLSKWHVRLETGYQEKNIYGNPLLLNDRFLPSEYFLALANKIEIHPLVELNGTIINDIKSGFTYFIAKCKVSLGSNVESEIFAFLPAAKGDSETENVSQKLVTTDLGIALRAFF